jgi:nucleotide-binding universal stress UspA family protein
MDKEIVSSAIEEAAGTGSELVVLTVLDPAIPTKVVGQFLETGHIGARPSQDFLDSLFKRHEQLSLQQADEIVSQASADGLSVRSEVRRGAYDKETARAIAELSPRSVVIEKRKRSLLRFATEDSFIDDLKREVGFKLIER